MVNNQPFPVEEARNKWRNLKSQGYLIERENRGQNIELHSQPIEPGHDWGTPDPVAAGYDGLNSEYWTAVGENADPDNHWGYDPDEQDLFID